MGGKGCYIDLLDGMSDRWFSETEYVWREGKACLGSNEYAFNN